MTAAGSDSAAVSVNIANRLRAAARRNPDKPAVVRHKTRERVIEQCTFAELDRDSDAAARGMLDCGIGRGTKTLVMLRPSVPFFSCFFGLFKAGAVPVFIDPGMGGKRLLECVRNLAPEAMIGVPLAHMVRRLRGKFFPGFKIAVTHGRRWFWGGARWETFRRFAGEPFPVAATAPDELAAILFTTGSTGPAKGVEYTHGALDSQAGILADAFGIAADDRDAATFPGFSLFSIALGMTAVVPDMNPTRPGGVFPPNILEPVRRERCTFSFGSPALWGRVSAYAVEKGVALPTLKRVVMAGAPVPAAVHERLLRGGVLPEGAETFTPYGATECMPVACIAGSEVLADTAALTARGKGVCVGRAARGVRVEIIRIADSPIPRWDDGLMLPEGEIGEIVVCSDHASRHYHNLPEADRLAKIADSGGAAPFWHRMGDVGYRDRKGRIWFCGRKAHRVRARGGDLFTVCCEAIFNNHPAVARSALVGVPAGDGFERPVIIIELRSGKPHSGLAEEILTLGRGEKTTSGIADALFHPAFPTDIRHNAKIRREDLAVWAMKKLA